MEQMYRVEDAQTGMRLDQFLKEQTGYSRADIQKQIKEDRVRRDDGKVLHANYRISGGDEIYFSEKEKEEMVLASQEIPLNILYEDEDMLVINKARGMVIHPGAGNADGTLVNALLHYCGDAIRSVGDPLRPGIVHRLDKDTSGVMVVAKTQKAYESLKKQIGMHDAKRTYLALVHGQMEGENGTIRYSLGRNKKDRMKWDVEPKTGKSAVTHFHVCEFTGKYSWVECRLETGRTHQIRVHMAYIGHPVVNDPLYGYKKDNFPIVGQALHSYALELEHPIRGEVMYFKADLPEDLLACLELARRDE